VPPSTPGAKTGLAQPHICLATVVARGRRPAGLDIAIDSVEETEFREGEQTRPTTARMFSAALRRSSAAMVRCAVTDTRRGFSSKSYYQVIKGVRYDREQLELANTLSAGGGVINKVGAEVLSGVKVVDVLLLRPADMYMNARIFGPKQWMGPR
jgi:hypothetical protein